MSWWPTTGRAPSATATFRYYAEALDKIYGEIARAAPGVPGLVHKEPFGGIGAIVPWNFPLMIGAWKLAPALAAGNSVVLKPAATASLTLLRLAELASEAGLPDGMLNVVTGQGSAAGEALALSLDLDVLVFTGSGATGRRLLDGAARSNLKRRDLELGGKSPNIVFADAPDLAEAARVSAGAIFRNAGQVCVAGSRLLVEETVHDDFVAALTEAAKTLRIGDPLDLGADLGAVNLLAQLAGNLAFVSGAADEGADLALAGARILQETGGWYMEPTVVTGVRAAPRIAREEVFGPVLAVTPFRTDGQAVALAARETRRASDETQDLAARRRRLLGTNVAAFHDDPVHIVRGDGVWLRDAAGRKYLVCYNNVPQVGHCHPRVTSAICEPAATLNIHSRYLQDGLLDHVERLTATFAAPLDTAVLTGTGSEANAIAPRMADAVTGRRGIIATDHSYHGNTRAVAQLSATSRPATGDPDGAGRVAHVPAPDSYRPLGGTPGRAHAEAFAAAVRGAGFAGIILCPGFVNEAFPALDPGWLDPALDAVRDAGGLFITDEVQSDFGRLGETMWVHERIGARPISSRSASRWATGIRWRGW